MSGRLSIRDQIRLILWLRWRVFRNSLHTLRGRLDVISQGLFWLMMGGLMLGGGVGIGVGAYSFVAHHQAARVADLFWVVFLFWQLYPVLIGAGGPQFEFGHLLHFPLRYGSFFALSLAYGLFDPAAVTSIFWLACLSAGAGAALPALLPWLVPLSLVFAAMNLLLSRAIATWADRWMAQRRTREVLSMLFVAAILAVQFLLPRLMEWQPGKRLLAAWLPALLGVSRALPPGVAGKTVAGVAAANVLAASAGFLYVCLYAVGFSWLLHRRLLAQYRGENLSEARVAARAAPSARRGVRSPGSAWPLPWRSRPTAAVFEREARYTLRNWPALFQLLMPAFLLLVSSSSFRHTSFFARNPAMVFPLSVAYAFLVEVSMIFNSLGYDGTGIRLLLLAPVPFRRIMLGKNLFYAVATFLNVLLLGICVRWLFGPLNLLVVAATLLASLYVLLANLAVGNLISVYFPHRLEFGAFGRGRGARGMAMAVGLGSELALVGTSAVVFVIGQALDRMGLALLIFFGLSALALAGYLFSLSRTERILLAHREALAEELCRVPGAS